MPAEALVFKWFRGSPGFVRQQLRLNPMDTRRLLQCLDHVREQPPLHLLAIVSIAAIAYKQVTDHTLIVFVNKERITKNASTRNRGVSRQKLGIHVAENHLRRATVIPAQRVGPKLNFVVQQGTQICRGKMPEIENLHYISWKGANAAPECENSSAIARADKA